jgi:hypothetical protein
MKTVCCVVILIASATVRAEPTTPLLVPGTKAPTSQPVDPAAARIAAMVEKAYDIDALNIKCFARDDHFLGHLRNAECPTYQPDITAYSAELTGSYTRDGHVRLHVNEEGVDVLDLTCTPRGDKVDVIENDLRTGRRHIYEIDRSEHLGLRRVRTIPFRCMYEGYYSPVLFTGRMHVDWWVERIRRGTVLGYRWVRDANHERRRCYTILDEYAPPASDYISTVVVYVDTQSSRVVRYEMVTDSYEDGRRMSRQKTYTLAYESAPAPGKPSNPNPTAN